MVGPTLAFLIVLYIAFVLITGAKRFGILVSVIGGVLVIFGLVGAVGSHAGTVLHAYRQTRPYAFVGLVVVAVLYGTYWLGQADAKTQETFLVTQSAPPLVVVGTFGDRMVEKRLDKIRTCLLGEIRITTIGDAPQSLRQRYLGKLRPCKSPRTQER